jgi:hypothetical protein
MVKVGEKVKDNKYLVLKRDDTFTDTATRAACCGLLFEGLCLSYSYSIEQARWTQGFLTDSGHRSVKPYVH